MFNKSPIFNRNDPANRKASALAVPGNAANPVAKPSGAPEQPIPRLTPAASESSGKALTAMAPALATPAATTPTDATASGNSMGARLIVGPDVKLKGAEILDCDTLVVEGRVEATMDSRVVRIAEGGSFAGKVSVDVAEIHGTFEGELTARSQLIIHSTGRVNGTIRYGTLVADEGCELCGDISRISPGTTARMPAKDKPLPVAEASDTLTAAVV